MSKTNWIKRLLAEKGVYGYTPEQFRQLKDRVIEYIITQKKSKYEAFEQAYNEIFRRGENESARGKNFC